MKPNQILKKKIQFFLEAPTDITTAEQEKTDRIRSADKSTVVNELQFGIGKYILAPAHNFVLNNRPVEGWTYFERGLEWLSYFVKKANPTSFSLGDEPFAAVIGMSWLYDKKDMTDNALELLKRRWVLKKEKAHEYVNHKEFLASLYEIYFNNNQSGLPVDFLNNDHIYKRLISEINAPNDQYMPLINEACDYHLLHTTLSADRSFIEFSFFELVPYEILCLLKTREKLGFATPAINHELMQTPLAQFQGNTSTYNPETDEVLKMIVGNRR
jgi:hypothetical protein